jgi:hypothetical protein
MRVVIGAIKLKHDLRDPVIRSTFKGLTQVVAPLGLLSSWIASVLYVVP